MRKLLISILFFTSSSAVLASDWEISTVNDEGDVHTINTEKIKRVKTILPSTGTVISGWVKTTYNDTDDGIFSKLEEYYIKCQEDEIINNSVYFYRADGTVLHSATNKVVSVDAINFQPVLPDTQGEKWVEDICYYSSIN